MIYTTVLNPSLDVCFPLTELKPGSTITNIASACTPAGKGINVARAIKTLGEDVCVAGLIPRNSKRQFASYLDSHSIEHALMPTDGTLRVNVTILEETLMQTTHLNSASVMPAHRLFDEFVDFFSGVGQAGDMCVFAGSLPFGVKDSLYHDLVKQCKKKKMVTILDTRDMPLKVGVRAKPDMIKPNLAELELLFDEQVRGVHHIALKGKRLLDMGIKSVFISLGADGMIALNENDCLLCNAPQIKARDTVGCGDAMVAGLVVAKARKFSFSETCRMALACGASNAMHEGPGVIDREEVAGLMEEVKIESV